MRDTIACPDCGEVSRRGKLVPRSYLEMTERNYSGCGVDYMHCPRCRHVFCVSYKVDKVKRDEAWEDKDEIAKAAAEIENRKATNLIKAMLKSPEKIAEYMKIATEEFKNDA